MVGPFAPIGASNVVPHCKSGKCQYNYLQNAVNESWSHASLGEMDMESLIVYPNEKQMFCD